MIYYVATKQRVRVPIDEALVTQDARALRQARELAASGPHSAAAGRQPQVPALFAGRHLSARRDHGLRLHGSPRSDVQQTLFDIGDRPMPGRSTARRDDGEVRRLVPARDDLRPLYLNTQGLRVGKSGFVLKMQEKDKVVQEVRINEICQLNLFGNIQLSTQAVQALCEQEVPIALFFAWAAGSTA